ncbi:MAG: S8 family serine peptidase [bacterium]
MLNKKKTIVKVISVSSLLLISLSLTSAEKLNTGFQYSPFATAVKSNQKNDNQALLGKQEKDTFRKPTPVTSPEVSPTTNKGYIIKFKQPAAITRQPLDGKAKADGRATVERQQTTAKQEILKKLNKRQFTTNKEKTAESLPLLAEYKQTSNAIAVDITAEEAKQIQTLPDVAGVYPNSEVHASLTDSVPLIGADKVWTDYNDQGEGVTVAVIDTGIDATHPDLGYSQNAERTFDKITTQPLTFWPEGQPLSSTAGNDGNFSMDGDKLAYFSNNRVFIYTFSTRSTEEITNIPQSASTMVRLVLRGNNLFYADQENDPVTGMKFSLYNYSLQTKQHTQIKDSAESLGTMGIVNNNLVYGLSGTIADNPNTYFQRIVAYDLNTNTEHVIVENPNVGISFAASEGGSTIAYSLTGTSCYEKTVVYDFVTGSRTDIFPPHQGNILAIRGENALFGQCFVGNMFDSYDLYNITTGSNKVLSGTGQPLTNAQVKSTYTSLALSGWISKASLQDSMIYFTKDLNADAIIAYDQLQDKYVQINLMTPSGDMHAQGNKVCFIGVNDGHIYCHDYNPSGYTIPNYYNAKVIGGYDFVNKDNRPDDDNGHGTHVSSIIAGDGTASGGQIKGVAPKAKLLAYKVLNSSGSGYFSDIMSAIERATDPNQDGDTSDHVDVINMSLGGSGSPDDPLSQAVNAASNAGVVVVVAAGNSGPDDVSVGSPGLAEKAITVGSSTHHVNSLDSGGPDKLSWFSSKGPVLNNYFAFKIKPDILAPGGDVCLSYDCYLQGTRYQDGIVAARAATTSEGTLFNQSYTRLSGTSMAAPHVAGAAALLKHAHPGLSPEQVKALLMQNTVDLGLKPEEQGSGRMNILQSITAPITTAPAILDFQEISPTSPKTVQLELMNVSNQQQTITLGTSANLPSDVAVIFQNAQLTLAPSEKKTVPVTLQVTNDNAPFFNVENGTITMTSGTITSKIPVSYYKSTQKHAGTFAISQEKVIDTRPVGYDLNYNMENLDNNNDAKDDYIVSRGNQLFSYSRYSDAETLTEDVFYGAPDVKNPDYGWYDYDNYLGLKKADFNGDGKTDIAVSGWLGQVTILFRNDTPPAPQQFTVTPGQTVHYQGADITLESYSSVYNSSHFVVTTQENTSWQGDYYLTNVQPYDRAAFRNTIIKTIQINPSTGETRIECSQTPYTPVFVQDFGDYVGKVEAIDVDKDGDLDLIVPFSNPSANYLPDSNLAVLKNDGSGKFSNQTLLYHQDSNPIYSLAAGDFDGDGASDLLVSTNETIIDPVYSVDFYKDFSSIRLFKNNNNGTFTPSGNEIARYGIKTNGYVPYNHRINAHLLAADFDGNGAVDFVESDNSGQVEYFKNNGAGQFVSQGIVSDLGGLTWGGAVTDFNKDGKPDLLLPSLRNDNMAIFTLKENLDGNPISPTPTTTQTSTVTVTATPTTVVTTPTITKFSIAKVNDSPNVPTKIPYGAKITIEWETQNTNYCTGSGNYVPLVGGGLWTDFTQRPSIGTQELYAYNQGLPDALHIYLGLQCFDSAGNDVSKSLEFDLEKNTPTATNTSTETATITFTNTATNTVTVTPTETLTPSPTNSITSTQTPTPTATKTLTPSITNTSTPTVTSSSSQTATATSTTTPTATETIILSPVETVLEFTTNPSGDIANQDGPNKLDVYSSLWWDGKQWRPRTEYWIGTGIKKDDSYLAIRFHGSEIPADAIIVSASLQLTNNRGVDQWISTSFEMKAENSKAPQPFNCVDLTSKCDTKYPLPSSRSLTNAKFSYGVDKPNDETDGNRRWLSNPNQQADPKKQDPYHWQLNVTDVVRELSANGTLGDTVAFIAKGKGEKAFGRRFMYNTYQPNIAASTMPKLFITIKSQPIKPVSPTPTPEPRKLNLSIYNKGTIQDNNGTTLCTSTGNQNQCEKEFPVGQPFTLTAVGAVDTYLLRWDGCTAVIEENGQKKCSITLTETNHQKRYSVRAWFTKKPELKLAVSGRNSGKITSENGAVTCEKGQGTKAGNCTSMQEPNSTLRLIASPVDGFKSWVGGGLFGLFSPCNKIEGNNGEICVVTFDKSKTVIAQFK